MTVAVKTPLALDEAVDRHLREIEANLIAWRRDFHQHPELGNRETRTSGIVAAHLERLGLKVTTGIAHTGVVAVLEGARPGPVVGLRADMDALPIVEQVDVSFRSEERTEYNGELVGVMHACGHDGHTAVLMAVAEALTKHRSELPGTVKFIFQPAEEGAPDGEEGGAALMIREGVLEHPKPDMMMGLHFVSPVPSDQILYYKGAMLASADIISIKLRGKQGHGARPWTGIDPIVSAAQVVLGLQTIVSRQVDVTREPTVLSITINRGGIRHNIVPEIAELGGTLRTFDEGMRTDIHARIKRTAEMIAASSGVVADVDVKTQYPVTFSRAELAERIVPALERAAGPENVRQGSKMMAADDFAFFGHHVPTTYFVVGCATPEQVAAGVPNHSPRFHLDESSLLLGARALAAAALDILHGT
ncbi:MAG: amidohydrolase [Candidatus Lustribacter sp.]